LNALAFPRLEEQIMTGVLKKGLGLIVVVFIIWYMFTDPNGLAQLSKEIGTWIWDTLVDLFQALTRFLTAIFSS
jgi:hypothetical protein